MKEIEILVEVFDDESKVLNQLNQYEFVAIQSTIDTYYYDPLRKNLQPDETLKLFESFRLRKKNDQFFLTYKVDNYENGVWIYSDEEEIKISDYDCAKKILAHLGLKKLVEIDNQKHTFKTDKFEIVFEKVKDLGLFLEVEYVGKNQDEDVLKIKMDINKFITSLGLEISSELNSGKPELMLKKIGNVN